MPKKTLVDIDVHLHWQTDRAIKVSLDGEDDKAVWLPKSAVDYDEDKAEPGKTLSITLPETLAIDKELA